MFRMLRMVVDLGKERGAQIAQRVAGLVVHHIKIDGDEIRLHLFLCFTKQLNGFGESRNGIALIHWNFRLGGLFLSKKVHHSVVSFPILTILSGNSFY